jgi:hypothetical protein
MSKPVPDRIACIDDPLLRGRAIESWVEARSLLHAVGEWRKWPSKVSPNDYVPILRLSHADDLARHAVDVLLAHGAASRPGFDAFLAEVRAHVGDRETPNPAPQMTK